MMNIITITHAPDAIRIKVDDSSFAYPNVVELAEGYGRTLAENFALERDRDWARKQLADISKVLADENIDNAYALKASINGILSFNPMNDLILKIIRDGWPMSTSEVLHEMAVRARLRLLPDGITPPATVAELSPMVNELHREGRLEKVDGGWKWIPEKVRRQQEMFV